MLLRGLWIAILTFMFSSVFIGCSKTQFVVLRDVPEAPSFVVIPANNYLSQVKFANEIEAAIISVGVKVVMRPATRDVTKEIAVGAGIQAIEGNQAAQKAGAGKLTERYVAFEAIDADYIVRTYVGSGQIRIMKNHTREILAVLTVPTDPVTDTPLVEHKFIADALAKMGIPIIPNRKQDGGTPRPMRNSP